MKVPREEMVLTPREKMAMKRGVNNLPLTTTPLVDEIIDCLLG